MQLFTLASLLALFDRETRPDLFGARSRGSVSETGLESLSDRPAVEFRPKVGANPVARYFRVECPEIAGRLGAVRLADLTEEQQKLLRVRHVENHGLEMYLDQSQESAVLVPVDHATIILGPSGDAEHGEDSPLVPWTWFPGAPLGDLNSPETPLGDVAVKLHNG